MTSSVNSSEYTPQSGDVTRYLRATATYRDRHHTASNPTPPVSAVSARVRVGSVVLELSPGTIDEDGGQTTVTATLTGRTISSRATEVTVSAESPGAAQAFRLSGDLLTIARGEKESTGTVTLTALDNEVDEANKTVEVRGTATNDLAVNGPDSVTLTITDNDDPPTVELVLTPDSITEDGGQTRVTARLTDRTTSSVATEVTVSAVAKSPATAPAFRLSGDPLTIAPGAKESTGTVTITALDNEEFAPDKTVTVSGSVAYDLPDKPALIGTELTITDDWPTVRSTDATRTTYDDYAYTEGEQTPVDTFMALVPEGASVAWTVTGADAAQLTITDDGVLRFKKEPPGLSGNAGL